MKSRFIRNLIASSTLAAVLAGGSNTGKAEPTGSVEGHLRISLRREVNLADDANPGHEQTAQLYSEYPLIIRNRNGEKEVRRATADANGSYRVSLPPGDYILDVEGRAPGHVRAKPQPFTVVSGQTVRVDMDIDTGIR